MPSTTGDWRNSVGFSRWRTFWERWSRDADGAAPCGVDRLAPASILDVYRQARDASQPPLRDRPGRRLSTRRDRHCPRRRGESRNKPGCARSASTAGTYAGSSASREEMPRPLPSQSSETLPAVAIDGHFCIDGNASFADTPSENARQRTRTNWADAARMRALCKAGDRSAAASRTGDLCDSMGVSQGY